jgi:VIT1/CCC1 family predicted Fe2+/Mn2+ transporter
MMADTCNVIDALACEELGIDPKELGGSAYEAASTSFGLFAVGAAFPILPFVFWSGTNAVLLSLIASATGLLFIGTAIMLVTGRFVLFSGVRQVLVGMVAAALTYGVRRLIGISVNGESVEPDRVHRESEDDRIRCSIFLLAALACLEYS